MESAERPKIIVRKVAVHSEHHGGAWKVAYADFVTAMMALFIVLWLMNCNKDIRDAVGGYFRDPLGSSKLVGARYQGTGDHLISSDVKLPANEMPELREQIKASLRRLDEFERIKNQIEFTVTPEGLRIDLMESSTGTFFENGSSALNADGTELLQELARQLMQLPNRITVEGHTDSKPYADGSEYGNWELSMDRANAARRCMESAGLRQNQVALVRGFADQRLRVPENPLDPSNRRVSLVVHYPDSEAYR